MAQINGFAGHGDGYSALRVGTGPDAVSFRVEPAPWDGESEAACRVSIREGQDTIVDRDVYGIDPLQALECALHLVRTFVVMIEPDADYVAAARPAPSGPGERAP